MPEETVISVDIGYATAVFAIPDDAPSDWKAMRTLPRPPESSRGGSLLPLEGGRWVVTLGGRHGDKPPGDTGGFRTFAQQLRTPTLYKAIGHAKRLDDVVRFGFSASVSWHFERLKTRSHRLTPKLFGTRRHQQFLMIVDPADRGLSDSVCLDPAREPAATAHAAKDDSARCARL